MQDAVQSVEKIPGKNKFNMNFSMNLIPISSQLNLYQNLGKKQ